MGVCEWSSLELFAQHVSTSELCVKRSASMLRGVISLTFILFKSVYNVFRLSKHILLPNIFTITTPPQMFSQSCLYSVSLLRCLSSNNTLNLNCHYIHILFSF